MPKQWQKPKGMHAAIARKVLEGKICGARTRAGKFCMQKPIKRTDGKPKPWRCRMHGGKIHKHPNGKPPGLVPGHQINKTFGIWAEALTEEEKNHWYEMTDDSLEALIKFVKIRLRRTVIAQMNYEKDYGGPREEKHTALDTIETTTGGLSGGVPRIAPEIKKIRKMPNFENIINSQITQLVRLIGQQQSLTGAGNLTSQQKAELAVNLLAQARSQVVEPSGAESS